MTVLDAFITQSLKKPTIISRIRSKISWFIMCKWSKDCYIGPSRGMNWVKDLAEPAFKGRAPRGSVLCIGTPVDRMGSIISFSAYRRSEPEKVYSRDVSLLQSTDRVHGDIRVNAWLVAHLLAVREHGLTDLAEPGKHP